MGDPGMIYYEGIADLATVGVAGGGTALGATLVGMGAAGAAATVALPLIGAAAVGAGLAGMVFDKPVNTMDIIRLPRKGDPGNPGGRGKGSYDKNGADISLDFRDNSMGTRKGLGFGTNKGGNEWSYGFEVQCYYSDIEYIPGTFEKQIQNRPDDNIRVQIVEKVNYGAKRKFASPMSKQITAADTKLPPFDLPNWIENIPIVGWALEAVMKLIMLPFSALMSGILQLTAYSGSEKVQRSRKYEFMGIDDGLDAFAIAKNPDANQDKSLSLDDFPHYTSTLGNVKSWPPQIYALADLTGQTPSGALKNKYDGIMSGYYKDFAKAIGQNKNGWLYGSTFDFLTEDDFEYGVDMDGEWVSYENAGYDDENMTLGISYNEFRLGRDRARVIYLNPMAYGGKFSNPPVFVTGLFSR